MKKYLLIATILIISAMTIPRADATDVTNMQVSSEKGKTRIMVQLSAPAQYKVRYTSEPAISIYLTDAKLGNIEKTRIVGDEFVKEVAFGEPAIGILEAKILLNKSVIFNVSPLESPNCVTIEIMDDTNAAITESKRSVGAFSSAQSTTHPAKDSGVENALSLSSISGSVAQTEPSTVSFLPSFFANNFMTIQLCLDSILIIALVLMFYQLRRVTKVSKRILHNMKVSKRNFTATNSNQTFSELVDVLQEKNPKRNAVDTEGEPFVQTATLYKKDQETGEREEGSLQLSSLQKQHRKVYELAELGMDRLTISQKSNIPIGEVNLILDLSKGGSRGKYGSR